MDEASFFFCDGTRLLVLGRTLLVFLANTTYIHNNTGICDESSVEGVLGVAVSFCVRRDNKHTR